MSHAFVQCAGQFWLALSTDKVYETPVDAVAAADIYIILGVYC